MEVININGNRWIKTIGDEGQDVLVAEFVMKEEDVIGKYPSEELYDLVIDKDTDLYLPSGGFNDELTEDRVAFKFRKATFTQEEQDGCLEGLWDAAVVSDNRAMAAGPRPETHGKRDWVKGWQMAIVKWFAAGQPPNIDGSDPIEDFRKNARDQSDNRSPAWIRFLIEKDYEDYRNFFEEMVSRLKEMSISEATDYAKFVQKEFMSDTGYGARVWSGIAGFYDRYPRIPFGRPTSYTENHPEKFAKCIPFARKLDAEFARLLPHRYASQKALADNTDKRFLIGEDTTFTTITVNTTTKERNARMACHRDAGSLNEGFSNLAVIGDGKKSWRGGYLVCPEVRVAINVRPGDLLLVDNMRVIHGNTPIESPESGEDDLLRMSLIFYYRENMKSLGSWEYESTRRQFVSDRSRDNEHPLWWSRWNGVSPGMWDQKEWYDYLEGKMGKDTVVEYHPEANKEVGSLEDFLS
jgi:hypothetical protein